MFSSRCAVIALGLVAAVTAAAGGLAPPSPDAKVEVLSSSVQEVSGEKFFRIKLTWPSADIPRAYLDFAKNSTPHFGRTPAWPSDGLALISSTPNAFSIFPEEGRNREFIAPEISFVGKLQETGTQAFVLRCPGPEGSWRYLPLTAEFGAAQPGKDLANTWSDAEIAFLASNPGAAGQSFYAYARQRINARLGKPDPVDTSWRPEWGPRPNGRDRLYEITTGAMAIQESLQLDRMRNPRSENIDERKIAVDSIAGVSVRSHPWPEMIGDRKPTIDPLATLIPQDNYYVRFRTTKALRDFLSFSETWGGSVLSEIEVAGRDYGVRDKLETQICLKSSWLSELLGPAVIDSLALTGSDPYLREGSDFSIVIRLKSREVFDAAAKRYLDEARRDHADIHEETLEYSGASVSAMTTPDGVIRSYRAYLGDCCIYSNSMAAMRRIIDAQAGRLPSLAKSLDFVYIRTVYPESDREEDGFVFLSDPFIRALVGPRLRIAEKRRLEALTSLEMIKNAALFYLWEHPGAASPSLEQLYQQRYLDADQVKPESGDRFSWDPAAFIARSERYGRLGQLTPIVEMSVDQVTATEKTEYEQFRTRYQDYWRRYFDPIGMRVTVNKDIRLSVTILPLIDNSEYDQLVENFGGQVTNLQPAHKTDADVFHFVAHLNPESQTLKEVQNFMMSMLPEGQRASLDWIGERMEFWIEDSDAFLEALRGKSFGTVFKIPAAFGIQVKNPLTLATFLVGVQAMVKVSAPNIVVFEPTEPYRDMSFTAIKPVPQGMFQDQDFKQAAIYYGNIGGYLYVSTSLDLLHHIVDGVNDAAGKATSTATAPPATADPTSADKGHMSLSIIPAHAKKSRPALEYYLADQAWNAEQANMRDLWLVAHTVGLGKPGAPPPERVLGCRLESALGNGYRYDAAHDEIVGSVTGPMWGPSPNGKLPEQSPLHALLGSIDRVRASLQFTRDGLRTELAIERNR